MSRNKGRTKATSPAPAQAVKAAPTQTTGLSYVTPTEFVELPSRGQSIQRITRSTIKRLSNSAT